jgi:hypothetical protein
MQLSTARKVLASFILIPPVLWFASGLIGPDTGNGSSTKDQLKALGKIADHKNAFVASGILFVVGAMVFLIATYGFVHVFRGRKVGIGQVAAGLIAIGMSVFFAFYGFGITQYAMVNHAQFLNAHDQLVFAQLQHFAQQSGPGSLLFIAFLLGLVVGPVLLGIAMIRRRNVPLWAGILTIVTGPAGFFADGKVGNSIFQVVLFVALAPLALLIWRMSDEAWDAPREVAGARRGRPAAPEPAAPAAAAAV